MKHVILGDGLLGTELFKQTKWPRIARFTHTKMDFANIKSYRRWMKPYDVIVNCIAHTNTYEKEKETHWNVNYKGVVDLVDWCNENDKKIVHISTDYLYSNSKINASENDVPVHCANWYGYTKLLADGYVQLKAQKHLIIRCTHKPYPFPYESAFVNQIGNFDYVDRIAFQMKELILMGATGIFNVGTEPKTMFELAKRSNSSVRPRFDKIDETMPENTLMNCSKTNEFLGNRTLRLQMEREGK